MRLTTKSRFAVTAMLEIALKRTVAPITLANISLKQNISLSYLEQLFGKLRQRGLVISIRGPGGGYELARSPKLINIADIVTAVDELLDATQCQGKGHCNGYKLENGHCRTHHLWSNLNLKIIEYLSSITLDDLIKFEKPNTSS